MTTPTQAPPRNGNGNGSSASASANPVASSVPSSRPHLRFGYDHPPTATPPTADGATFRDLLIFEERLKQNAARLLRRKRKYQSILVLLCAAIVFLAYRLVLVPPAHTLIQYTQQGLLVVCCTTLFLFFASGMYAERIVAANRFVPQANRALRPFNMYLNTRRPPRNKASSWFGMVGKDDEGSGGASTPGKGAILPMGSTSTTANTRLVRGAPDPNNPNAPPPIRRMVIPPIPPSTNPRGEIIFSTKVASGFREGYERYRNAFERRRREKLVAAQADTAWSWWRRGEVTQAKLNEKTPPPPPPPMSRPSNSTRPRGGSTSSLASTTTRPRRDSASSFGSKSSEKQRRGRATATTAKRREAQHKHSLSSSSSSSSSSSAASSRSSSPDSLQPHPEEEDERVVAHTIAPDITKVAQSQDARTDAESTLREPEPISDAETDDSEGTRATLTTAPLVENSTGTLIPPAAAASDSGWIEVRRTASHGSRKKRASGAVAAEGPS